MIKLIWDLRAMNVIATIENDPRKIMDVKVPTMIFNVRSQKMHRKFAKKYFFCDYNKSEIDVNWHVQHYIFTKFGNFSLKNKSDVWNV